MEPICLDCSTEVKDHGPRFVVGMHKTCKSYLTRNVFHNYIAQWTVHVIYSLHVCICGKCYLNHEY